MDSGLAQSRHWDDQKAVHFSSGDSREAWIAYDRGVHWTHFHCASRRVLPSIVSQLSYSTFSRIFSAVSFQRHWYRNIDYVLSVIGSVEQGMSVSLRVLLSNLIPYVFRLLRSSAKRL